MQQTKVTGEKPNTEKKYRLKATLEASRIVRLGDAALYSNLDSFKLELKRSKGERKKYLKVLVKIIEEKLEKKDRDIANMSYAEYGETMKGGGGGEGRGEG